MGICATDLTRHPSVRASVRVWIACAVAARGYGVQVMFRTTFQTMIGVFSCWCSSALAGLGVCVSRARVRACVLGVGPAVVGPGSAGCLVASALMMESFATEGADRGIGRQLDGHTSVTYHHASIQPSGASTSRLEERNRNRKSVDPGSNPPGCLSVTADLGGTLRSPAAGGERSGAGGGARGWAINRVQAGCTPPPSRERGGWALGWAPNRRESPDPLGGHLIPWEGSAGGWAH
jgi:hypothetical protein